MLMRSPPMMVMTNLLSLLVLFVLGGDVTASSSSVSAFHGVHYGTHSSVRRRVKSMSMPMPMPMPMPFTKTTPSPQRSEIMKMYKSKSDNDDDDDTSKSRSWFKPWRWFARRQRRKNVNQRSVQQLNHYSMPSKRRKI